MNSPRSNYKGKEISKIIKLAIISSPSNDDEYLSDDSKFESRVKDLKSRGFRPITADEYLTCVQKKLNIDIWIPINGHTIDQSKLKYCEDKGSDDIDYQSRGKYCEGKHTDHNDYQSQQKYYEGKESDDNYYQCRQNYYRCEGKVNDQEVKSALTLSDLDMGFMDEDDVGNFCSSTKRSDHNSFCYSTATSKSNNFISTSTSECETLEWNGINPTLCNSLE